MTSVQTNIFLHFPPCLPSCTYVKLVCVVLTNSGATFHAQSRLLDIFSVFLGERRCCLTSGEDSGVRQVGCINAARTSHSVLALSPFVTVSVRVSPRAFLPALASTSTTPLVNLKMSSVPEVHTREKKTSDVNGIRSLLSLAQQSRSSRLYSH